jgi:hypothetical protein
MKNRVARGAPTEHHTQYEQRSLSNHVEVIQGFLNEGIVGLEHQKDALCHRQPLLELLVLGILGIHDDGNRDAHCASVSDAESYAMYSTDLRADLKTIKGIDDQVW